MSDFAGDSIDYVEGTVKRLHNPAEHDDGRRESSDTTWEMSRRHREECAWRLTLDLTFGRKRKALALSVLVFAPAPSRSLEPIYPI